MIRIIHAADLHLDSPFESLDAEKASVRRSEQRALLERIAAEVNQRNADLLFLAGDLLDSGSAYAETGEALLAALGKVRVPVFIAPGNHDWYSRRSPYALLPFPDNVHIFRTPRLESVFLPELGARVWGAGYTSPSCEALLREEFDPDTDACAIGDIVIPVDAVARCYGEYSNQLSIVCKGVQTVPTQQAMPKAKV